MSAINQHGSKAGSLGGSGAADEPELIQPQQSRKAEHLAKDVAAVVNSFPPLSKAQLDRIAGLLSPVVGGDSAGGADELEHVKGQYLASAKAYRDRKRDGVRNAGGAS